MEDPAAPTRVPRDPSWPPMRTPAAIRAILDKKCPGLPANYVALLGPFESGDAAFEACNLMTRDRVTTRPTDPLFKPSLRVTRHAEGSHVIGRERDLLRFHWRIVLHVRANSERKRVWSLIGQWTVHRLPTSLIGREAVFGGFRG